MTPPRLMTADELAKHLDVSGLVAKGYTIEVKDATIVVTDNNPASFTYEVVWVEWPPGSSGVGRAPD